MVGKRKKNVFFSYFISGIPNFSYMGFFRKCSIFRWSIPLRVLLYNKMNFYVTFYNGI